MDEMDMVIGICDDEINFIKELEEKLSDVVGSDRVVFKEFMSGKELLDCTDKIDMLFLDILMSEPDGIETARSFNDKKHKALVIFVSVSKDYIFDVYSLDAFWYLIKPVGTDKLGIVYEAAKKYISGNKGVSVIFKTKKNTYNILTKDILYLESQLKNVIIHTDKGLIKIAGSMKEASEKLGTGFFLCHRSFYVNMLHIKSYNSNEIVLDSGEVVPMAKMRYHGFVDAYMEYLRF